MTQKHVPTRMCVICRRRAPKFELTRHVLPQRGATSSGDDLLTDERQVQPGRGWYVCSDKTCQTKIQKFCPRGRKRRGMTSKGVLDD